VTLKNRSLAIWQFSGTRIRASLLPTRWCEHRSSRCIILPLQPRQLAVTIAVRRLVVHAVSVKAEPVEEHKEKESGIILDLTRCGQRLNNRVAICSLK
jgi:hypothetical protein